MLFNNKLLRLSGLPGGSEAWWLWKNRDNIGRCLVLTASDEDAQTFYQDLQAIERWQNYLSPHPAPSPAKGRGKEEGPPSFAACFSEEDEDAGVTALSDWVGADIQKPALPFLMASIESLEKNLPSLDAFKKSHFKLHLGDRKNRDEFLSRLSQMGYNRVDTVEQIGEMAVRGEVMDVWSPGWDGPVRILWPFNQIESIRKIDMSTQRSSDALDDVFVRPANLLEIGSFQSRNCPPSAEKLAPSSREIENQNLFHSDNLFDYLGPDGTLFESNLPNDVNIEWTGKKIIKTDLGQTDQEETYLSPPAFGSAGAPGHYDIFAKAVKEWIDKNWHVIVFCHNPGEQERLEEILLEQDRSLVPYFENKRIDFPIGFLVRGFLSPDDKIAVLSNGEIFGRYKRRFRLPKFTGGKAFSEIRELSKGDYVVHERFGIGRYMTLERVEAAGMEADYLRLEYKGGDRVFVPLFEFKQVQKFIGTEGKKPKLSSLDTAAWEKTKKDVQKSVEEIAQELLNRAAKRASLPGHSFSSDSHMEHEFNSSFLYELTPDQAKAIDDTRQDMMRPTPMDRLVCGDVGYGKTEVAMRAAFKAVCAGKQVAVLVPTTILAEQHGRNFKERFADYPVSIAVLSRFNPPDANKRIVKDMRRGVIDIAIGTHRLLSADIAFKNLGLIIIDEEHRFGVKQKERITAYRDTVDVLALSATPIPRTLGASLGGIKSLSIIETPPEGRLPISTHVGPYDEKIIMAAVEQEIRRNGQVFYVHNRVGTIEDCGKRLTQTLSEHGLHPKITVAHGKMTGPQLEKTMWDFHHKKFDILLSTTIIESGLDIPSVNTLIVEEAEDFGLAQLYQLRGRVGRERQKAYCFLFYSIEAALTQEAQKRLTALKEFASLGSGFKLALRDLEIRGAGNLLGPQQHGFVNAIGLDLYGQLLSEEITRQKGESLPEKSHLPEVSLELPVSAYIPEDYLPSESERIVFYKRLLDASSFELNSLREELHDRCGILPEPAERLFDVAKLRNMARQKKVTHLSLVQNGLEIRFHPDTTFAPDQLNLLTATHAQGFSFLPGPPFGMRIENPPQDDLINWTRRFLSTLG